MTDEDETQLIDAAVVDDAPTDVLPPTPGPPERRGPGGPLVVVLALLALAGFAAATWAYADGRKAKDDLAEARDGLEATRDSSAAGDEEADDRIDELTEANAKLESQLEQARAALAAAKKAAAADEEAVSSDDSLVAAAKDEVTSMLNATDAGCANYTVIGRSDAGDYGVVRADWSAGTCASNYETIEFLFKDSGSEWDRVPLTAHPVGEPDLDSGVICNQVISGVSEAVKDKITEACH